MLFLPRLLQYPNQRRFNFLFDEKCEVFWNEVPSILKSSYSSRTLPKAEKIDHFENLNEIMLKATELVIHADDVK
jgi:hypothetical protein